MKKWMTTALIMASVLTLASCGKAPDQPAAEATTEFIIDEGSGYANLDPKEYLKLGEYKGLEIEKTKAAEVTDADVEEYLTQIAADYVEYHETKAKTSVSDGDTISVSFTIEVDGQVLEDYTTEEMQMEIGQGYYTLSEDFDFDKELTGAKVGEPITMNLKFPEDYGDDETVAGKDCVVHATVLAILEEVQPEINDAWAKENFDVEDLAGLRATLKEELEMDAESTAEIEDTEKLWEKIRENTTQIKDFPKEVIEAGVKEEEAMAEEFAGYEGMDVDEFIKEQYGEEGIEGVIKEAYFTKCLHELIIDEEGLIVSDDEIEEMIMSYVDGENFTSREEVIETIGDESEVRTQLLDQKLEEFIIANNIFK